MAQLASVRALGAWGRGFESRLPDLNIKSDRYYFVRSGLVVSVTFFIGKKMVTPLNYCYNEADAEKDYFYLIDSLDVRHYRLFLHQSDPPA